MSVSVMPCTPIGVARWLLLIVAAHSSISPSKTVSAGPVISTGAPLARPFDRQAAAARLDVDLARRAGRGGCRRRPRRRRRCRRPASRRRRARRRAGGCASRATTCMKPALTPCGKRAWRSISGPCVATGAASTSATSCTACGLPIETHRDLDACGRRRARAARARSRRPRPARREARWRRTARAPARRSGAPMSTVTRPSSCRRSSSRRFIVLDDDRALVGEAARRARSGRSSARRCRTARPRRRCRR